MCAEGALLALCCLKSGKDTLPFKDLADGTAKSKPGYAKLQFCGNQAGRHGLNFFGVDTSWAVSKNPMAWSSRTPSAPYSGGNVIHWDTMSISQLSQPVSKMPTATLIGNWPFGRAGGYTRGWTLQELIAPKIVEFSSEEGERPGEKEYWNKKFMT